MCTGCHDTGHIGDQINIGAVQFDQIRTVLPDELEDIEIEEGKDYVTLVTCTPYGVNSHRLLVRGHRTENAKSHLHVTPDAVQISERITTFVLMIIFILIMVIVSAVLPV